ncbi:hypothetical protein ACHQM5_006238 [Ranunculus cassubicifolius]
MVTLFRVFTRYLFRYQSNEYSSRKNFYSSVLVPIEDDHIEEEIPELEEEIPELEVIDYEETEYDGFERSPTTPKFSFKFDFQNFEDTSRNDVQNFEDGRRNNGENFTASTSKYEFLPKNVFSGFMEEPGSVSFSVKEMFLNSHKEITLDDGFLCEKDFLQNSVDSGEDSEKQESVILSDGPRSEKEEGIVERNLQVENEEQFSEEDGENKLVSSDSEAESVHLWDKFSVMVDKIESDEEEFLSDGDFDGAEQEISEELEKMKDVIEDSGEIRVENFQNSEEILDEGGVGRSSPSSSVIIDQEEHELTGLNEVLDMISDNQKLEELKLPSSSILETDSEIEREFSTIQAECQQEGSDRRETGAFLASEEDSDEGLVRNMNSDEVKDLDEVLEMIDDIEKLEQINLPSSSNLVTDAHIERQFSEIEAECELEDASLKGVEILNKGKSLEESSMKLSTTTTTSEFEESKYMETQWEHQDFIEQLQMEIRQAKATGLPTIFEESESPRMSEDLKPWKIEEQFGHADQVGGVHKYYRNYKERMRKFDILNYQKMYAIGFLQMKDPLQSISLQKSSGPTLTSVLSQNFLLPKTRKPVADSSEVFLKELQNGLELVYVGQMCLSWEFLNWQYGKAKELLASDPYEIRPYNNVAGEFQQFQVLMQRFMENERFQGPRVHFYIKSRCVLRNLLQVPVIKEGPINTERKENITCSMLLGIIEDCIRVYWEFVRSDKSEGNIILKGLAGPQGKVVDPADSKLYTEVQTSLQKKEKKLKDIMRSGNCIVKKFQKHPKEQSDQLLFFSQIDLKLVARVLRMSRITSDQLAWCQTKLDRISFVHRKIHVETSFSSFLLFPC